MMNIEFKQLSEVRTSEIMALMNNPKVRRQMLLLQGAFGEGECEAFF